jgi:hypothetical protein
MIATTPSGLRQWMPKIGGDDDKGLYQGDAEPAETLAGQHGLGGGGGKHPPGDAQPTAFDQVAVAGKPDQEQEHHQLARRHVGGDPHVGQGRGPAVVTCVYAASALPASNDLVGIGAASSRTIVPRFRSSTRLCA